MNPDELKRAAMGASADQAEAALEQVARLLGSFFQNLVKHGIPHELAGEMTRDYFEALRERVS